MLTSITHAVNNTMTPPRTPRCTASMACDHTTCVKHPDDATTTILDLPNAIIVHILTMCPDLLTMADWASVQSTCTHLRRVVIDERIPQRVYIDARRCFTRPRTNHTACATPANAPTPAQRVRSLCHWLHTHRQAIQHVTLANHSPAPEHDTNNNPIVLFGGSPAFTAYHYQLQPGSRGRRQDDLLTTALARCLGPQIRHLVLHNTPVTTHMAALLGEALGCTLRTLGVSCDRSYRGQQASMALLKPLLQHCVGLDSFSWTGVRMQWHSDYSMANLQPSRAQPLSMDVLAMLPSLRECVVDDVYLAVGGEVEGSGQSMQLETLCFSGVLNIHTPTALSCFGTHLTTLRLLHCTVSNQGALFQALANLQHHPRIRSVHVSLIDAAVSSKAAESMLTALAPLLHELTIEGLDALPTISTPMTNLTRLHWTLHRQHRRALVQFSDNTLPRMLPALQHLSIGCEGGSRVGALVVALPDTIAAMPQLTLDATVTWQVYSCADGAKHRATYRPSPLGVWTVHVECGLGHHTASSRVDVGGAVAFLQAVQGGFGGVMARASAGE